MAMMRATDKEALLDTIQTEGWPVTLKLLDDLVQSFESEVLSHDLNNPNVTELVIKKARAEGAKRLVARLKTQLSAIKP
jgi:hypothetical protein